MKTQRKVQSQRFGGVPTLSESAQSKQTEGHVPGVNALIASLARLCVRLGVGYGQFSSAAKQPFFEAADRELCSQGLKRSASALSLLSGLHKADVNSFIAKAESGELTAPELGLKTVKKVSPTSQIVVHWLALGLPKTLPLKGESGSFAALIKVVRQVRGVPNNMSLRLALQELERLGYVTCREGTVELLSDVGLSNLDAQDDLSHLVGAVRDHLEVCLSNIDVSNGNKLLEQCISVDGLHAESAETIHAMARVWWMKALRTIGPEAISLSERDEPTVGSQRLRFGVYFYTQDTAPSSPPPNPIHLS